MITGDRLPRSPVFLYFNEKIYVQNIKKALYYN